MYLHLFSKEREREIVNKIIINNTNISHSISTYKHYTHLYFVLLLAPTVTLYVNLIYQYPQIFNCQNNRNTIYGRILT